MDREKDISEYRIWLQRQIIFKRQQMTDRMEKMEQQFDHFKDKRAEKQKQNKLAKYGYERDKAESGYAQYLA